MRYFTLYTHFLRFSFSKAMEFRMDFFFRIVMDFFFYMANIIFFKILFLHTDILGAWNEKQLMIFVATFLLNDALFMTFFANNMWWLPFYVNRGDLDYYLVRPVSSLFFLSLREFAANSFINLIMALAIVAWSFNEYGQVFTLPHLLLYGILVVNGVLLSVLIRILLILPVFWTQSERGFAQLMDSMAIVQERPHHIYQGRWKFLLFTFLPFCLIASYPCQLLFEEELNWSIFFHCLAITLSFFLAVLGLWKWALRNYGSASS